MNEYMFDKRKRKRSLLKYLVIFLIAFVPVVLLNVYVFKNLKSELTIFLDSVILLAFALVGNIIAGKYFAKKDAKLAKKIEAREEMQQRKNEILEQSYKRKRQKKLEDKQKKEKVGNYDETNNKESK